jgi:hypothetical protein
MAVHRRRLCEQNAAVSLGCVQYCGTDAEAVRYLVGGVKITALR